MDDVSGGLRVASEILRPALFVVAVVFGVVAVVDWAVRTRRLNPFGGIARFFRRSVDPLMVPIERRVVRAGGRPSSAPLWALVAVVVGGLLLLAILDFVIGQMALAGSAFAMGPRAVLIVVVRWAFAFLRFALIVRVISSWVRVSPYSRWIWWSYRTTEWMLAPLRRVIPLLGGIDVTPIVAYLLLGVLEAIVLRALAF
jgi:YggT family protein